MSQRLERYREWLHSRELRFGFADEIADYALRSKITAHNDVPPVDMWHAILPTVALLEKVRERFGPTTITSAYRAPVYNAAIGGERMSWHMRNVAIDFTCGTGTPEAWHAFLVELRNDGAFKGGLGLYRTFVHVDTRGVNADWRGS